MVDQDELKSLILQMQAQKIEFAPGLSDAEVSAIERTCNFQFPADLRAFLQLGVPIQWKRHNSEGGWIDNRFPNWHEDPFGIMTHAREWAVGTFTFDIEYNDFWMEEWGRRPEELQEALALATRHIQAAPVLIPIFVHRFLPAEPNLPGNPVFSVWQAIDTIIYGSNLQTYLRSEFGLAQPKWVLPSECRNIRFWSSIAS